MNLPTYNQCIRIVNENPHGCFYERKYIVDDYDISIFSYRKAKYNNFILPLIDHPDINALEMKGIVFVFNDDNTIYNRYLMLNKFWEIDQYNHSKYELYQNKTVKRITTKEDGYLVSFIRLPNGIIISNEKNGFSTRINEISNEYLNDENYYTFIKNCIDSNIRPIFELVIENDMIVSYDKTSLILTNLRCNKTGRYLNLKDYEINIPYVKEYDYKLEEVYNLRKYVEGIEGWIVQFDDETMVKIKTYWWRNMKYKNKYIK